MGIAYVIPQQTVVIDANQMPKSVKTISSNLLTTGWLCELCKTLSECKVNMNFTLKQTYTLCTLCSRAVNIGNTLLKYSWSIPLSTHTVHYVVQMQ